MWLPFYFPDTANYVENREQETTKEEPTKQTETINDNSTIQIEPAVSEVIKQVDPIPVMTEDEEALLDFPTPTVKAEHVSNNSLKSDSEETSV